MTHCLADENMIGPGSATSQAKIRTPHPAAVYTKTCLARAGKHTAVVPCGSHPTGLGWLDQGGSSAADALMRRAMPPSFVEPAQPVGA